MPNLTYNDFIAYRDVWGLAGNRLMRRDEIEMFDDFFKDREESNDYQNEGFTRALVGDFSKYEGVEPMMKGYLGAKKCYELYERYAGDSSNPQLQQEIKERLMEADLRMGFAFGVPEDTDPDLHAFFKNCERIANRQMMNQTLEEPDPTAKQRLLDQLKQENPETAQEKFNTMLNQDLEQRTEIAKILFMNHLGKFKTFHPDGTPLDANENISEVYAHGGRTMFILPAGNDQQAVMDGIQGQHTELSGLQSRNFATHSSKPRTLNADGSVASEAKELKLSRTPAAYSPKHHRGMNASVGGLGQLGPNGRVITADGTNGHMYMHLISGKGNTCGSMLVGFENSGPGKKSRMGHTHDASAKKGGSSAFLSDKSYLGAERGGRVVDLSGLSGAELASLLQTFENGYRAAAMQAREGHPEQLNALNNLLTGKQMSVGQMKGMLQELNADPNQIEMATTARAGRPADPIASEDHPLIPVEKGENQRVKTIHVTQCEGLIRPVPPKVMKEPGFFQKVFHAIFHSKNSYVNQYKRYLEAIPAEMEAYNRRMKEYETTLASLERGEGEANLQASYDRAVQEAENAFGATAVKPAAVQNEALQSENNAIQNADLNNGKRACSEEMANRLTDVLLDRLFSGVWQRKENDESRDDLIEEWRGYIRNTEKFAKLLETGDEHVSAVIEKQALLEAVLGDISNEIMDTVDLEAKSSSNNEKQKTNENENKNEMEQKQPEKPSNVLG